MIWITFWWSSGCGQVKSGQTRSNSEVCLFKQNWCLLDSVFDGKFNGGMFVFVDDLELPKNSINNFVMHNFRGSIGNFVTKNWRIDSKFGMGTANTELYNIYSAFFNSKNLFFIVFYFCRWSRTSENYNKTVCHM